MVRPLTITAAFVAILVLAGCSSAAPASPASSDSPDGSEAPSAPREEVYMLQQAVDMTMEVSSASIKETGALHPDYTCEGADYSPHLSWSGLPAETQSVAVVVQDLDADEGIFAHWVLWGISPDVSEVSADSFALGSLPAGAVQGNNDFEILGWKGPCPPPRFLGYGHGASDESTGVLRHHHNFVVYALDMTPSLAAGATRNDLLRAIEGHVLTAGEVTATYLSKNVIRGGGM